MNWPLVKRCKATSGMAISTRFSSHFRDTGHPPVIASVILRDGAVKCSVVWLVV